MTSLQLVTIAILLCALGVNPFALAMEMSGFALLLFCFLVPLALLVAAILLAGG